MLTDFNHNYSDGSIDPLSPRALDKLPMEAWPMFLRSRRPGAPLPPSTQPAVHSSQAAGSSTQSGNTEMTGILVNVNADAQPVGSGSTTDNIKTEETEVQIVSSSAANAPLTTLTDG
jgi:hypothetical protein